jgi:hypothetical protein
MEKSQSQKDWSDKTTNIPQIKESKEFFTKTVLSDFRRDDDRFE